MISIIALAAILPVGVFASETIDIDKEASLTIQYGQKEGGLEGIEFTLYQVASVDAGGNFELTHDFSDYPIQTAGLDQSGWEQLADTLTGYAVRDRISPVDEGKTDNKGTLHFPAKGKPLHPGLYLLVGNVFTTEEYVYTTKPAMAALPMKTESSSWNYDVDIYPKYERKEAQDVSLKVQKVWDDRGFETVRPLKVDVKLLKNGEFYETVTLNKNNNWRYEWKQLDNRATWTAAENECGGYTTLTEFQNGVFTITNKYDIPQETEELTVVKKLAGDTPAKPETFKFVLMAKDEGAPMPEGSDNGTKEISITGAGTASFGRITFDHAGTYEYTVMERNTGDTHYTYDKSIYNVVYKVNEEKGKKTVERSITKSGESTADSIIFLNNYRAAASKLPQTGMLWWPVSALAVMGLLFILIGLVRRGNDDYEV